MIFPLHLAMTAAELAGTENPPLGCAWMACHFSSYGTGLSNCPESLPEHSVLILNDRTPPSGHDPRLIVQQLQQLVEGLKISCLLLDFQRQGLAENAAIAKAVVEGLPCAVGVSDLYAQELACPVFLPTPPLHRPLVQHLAPWDGRELWLEVALDSEQITITKEGCRFTPLSIAPENAEGFEDNALHCRYRIRADKEQAVFTLWRTPENLKNLLTDAAKACVTKAFGLYQELSPFQIEIGAC